MESEPVRTNGAIEAVDGATLVANDRILVDQEETGSHNGTPNVPGRRHFRIAR